MGAQPQPYKVNLEHERELAQRLNSADAAREPVVLEIAGSRYRLVPEDDCQTTDDPAANYAPARVLVAIDAGAGAFAGMDVPAFLEEIYEAREQDTPGRPA